MRVVFHNSPPDAASAGVQALAAHCLFTLSTDLRPRSYEIAINLVPKTLSLGTGISSRHSPCAATEPKSDFEFNESRVRLRTAHGVCLLLWRGHQPAGVAKQSFADGHTQARACARVVKAAEAYAQAPVSII